LIHFYKRKNGEVETRIEFNKMSFNAIFLTATSWLTAVSP